MHFATEAIGFVGGGCSRLFRDGVLRCCCANLGQLGLWMIWICLLCYSAVTHRDLHVSLGLHLVLLVSLARDL